MKLHRFFVGEQDLISPLAIHDCALVHQWSRVLRFKTGREIALFNHHKQEKLYKITSIQKDSVELEMVHDIDPLQSDTKTQLCFSLLKKDKNDWVLQKATELGISTFAPLLCERTEKTGFDVERAQKIITEAAEQCGRVDIPVVHEPALLQSFIAANTDNTKLYVSEQGYPLVSETKIDRSARISVLVGPEGGWTDNEKQLLSSADATFVSTSRFTLRAETAAITAAALFA